MSYGVYILVVVRHLAVGASWRSRRAQATICSVDLGHPRRSALVVLAAALVLGVVDVVGVGTGPEYEHVGHPRSWPPGSVSWICLLVAYGAVWVAVTGRPLIPASNAVVRGASLFRMMQLLVVLTLWVGMTTLSWTYLLNGLRAWVAEPEPTPTRPSAESQVDAALRETLDEMHMASATPRRTLGRTHVGARIGQQAASGSVVGDGGSTRWLFGPSLDAAGRAVRARRPWRWSDPRSRFGV